MYRNLTKFLLLACVTAVTLVLPSPALADPSRPALPVIDDGRWGPVGSSCEGAASGSKCDDENVIAMNYTRHTGGGGYVYGRCTIYKRASLRYVQNWTQHIMYGDVYASCPADATGEPGIVLPTCTWVGNFRGHTRSSIEFLGSFSGGGESVGKSCFRWSSAATTSPGLGNEPQNGVYEGQGAVELYTAPNVEFGETGPCSAKPGMCSAGSLYHIENGHSYNGDGALVHYETLTNRPTPPFDPQQRNFARVTTYDLTAFWSSTPFQWCQDGPGGCPPPAPLPPLPPNVASDPEPSTAQETGEAVAAGPPSSTAIATALRRAKNFWGGRGQLTSCMDNVRVAWAGPDDKLTEKHDNGGIFNKSLRQIGAAAGGSDVPGAVVFGCNSFGYHQQGNGGYVTDQRIVVNRAQNWPLRKLCVTLAHELGHMDRSGQKYGYTHGDNGGLAIMQGTVDGRINVDPKVWPPCQSG